MDNKFLEEYEAREFKELNKYISRVNEKKLFSDRPFPSLNRFPKIHNPYSRAIQGPDTTIWPQIPVTGSLIVSIYPTKESIFEDVHSFPIDEIPSLIKFIKNTGKVQFVLADRPTSYVGLAYLQPIFDELNPPLLANYTYIHDENAFLKGLIEFDKIANVNYYYNVFHPYFYERLGSKHVHNSVMADRSNFAELRAFHLDDIADDVVENLITNPSHAIETLKLSKRFLLSPFYDSLHSVPSYSLEQLNRGMILGIVSEKKIKEKIRFPYEIGSFLMKKLTFYPESFEACKQVISHFEENDVERVYRALNDAIQSSDIDSIFNNMHDFELTLDNAWSDSKKLKRKGLMIELGIDWLIGTCGFLIGGVPGLLTSLGIELIDKTSSKFSDRCGELISKKMAKPATVTIFDFQNKYKIPGTL